MQRSLAGRRDRLSCGGSWAALPILATTVWLMLRLIDAKDHLLLLRLWILLPLLLVSLVLSLLMSNPRDALVSRVCHTVALEEHHWTQCPVCRNQLGLFDDIGVNRGLTFSLLLMGISLLFSSFVLLSKNIAPCLTFLLQYYDFLFVCPLSKIARCSIPRSSSLK